MAGRLEQLAKEFHLKEFYSLVLVNTARFRDGESLNETAKLAPFLRKFGSTYINYYDLKNLPPLGDPLRFTNRLEEFYSGLLEQLITEGLEGSVFWLLNQRLSQEKPLFSSVPVAVNYPDITRSLNAMTELFRGIGPIRGQLYDHLLRIATSLLNPGVDEAFEEQAKNLLDELIAFNAREEGTGSEKFRRLFEKIEALNESISHKLMGNNTFVSLVQQITEINKALKTVFRKSFLQAFQSDTDELERFWNGLKSVGYVGGDQCLNGEFYEYRDALLQWLEQDFPTRKDELLNLLEAAEKRPELPKLDREPIPEAIQLYTLNLLGTIGLQTDEAIRLVLGFYSRFVGKTIRDGALQNLRKNADTVCRFFYRGLKTESDYQHQLSIAEKHDSIFDRISATSLETAFGESFHEVLAELDDIVGQDGFWLNDFVKSSYFIDSELEKDGSGQDRSDRKITRFRELNSTLKTFKQFCQARIPGVFAKLLTMWGFSYVVSWSLASYEQEERLFSFIIQAADEYQVFGGRSKDQIVPLNDIITLLTEEPDAKRLIEKLMTFLLNSKISFDFPLFQSLFRVVAQRNAQLAATVHIRDGFSEQRGYTSGVRRDEAPVAEMELLDPHIFHPIVVFLITVLNMKKIYIPKDAFVETDISLYLNSLAERQTHPELGYQMHLAHKLIASIPYIVDFASQHEGIIRKTIADLDESYRRKNVLVHYIRIKIHRAPSKLDLDYCLAVLSGLSDLPLPAVLDRLIPLMKGIGDEAIPDLIEYFDLYAEKLNTLAGHLKKLKTHYPGIPWQQIAEEPEFKTTVLNLSEIDEDSLKDILALVKLANALSNYWTQRINRDLVKAVFNNELLDRFDRSDTLAKLDMIRQKRVELQADINRFDPFLEPYQHIFLKRHVIQSDWNFDFFGFWPFYSEKKFETYNLDRKMALLERHTLETLVNELSVRDHTLNALDEASLSVLRNHIDCLVRIMVHQLDEGLAPSKYFLDTIDVLKYDQLSISQLHDVLGILADRELVHVDAFIAGTYGHFPEQITRALGRNNLDYDLGKLSQEDDELLYPLVQETVLGNIIADAQPIPMSEHYLSELMRTTAALKKLDPSKPVFPPESRPPREYSPVDFGYKAYALITLYQDGFTVPYLETLPVHFFQNNESRLLKNNFAVFKSELIQRICELEEKSGKLFCFQKDKLTDAEWRQIEQRRSTYPFNPDNAPVLLLSARSGSYRSMPGILGTVVNIGYGDFVGSADPPDDYRSKLITYRMFLSTFGNVVAGIRETEFSKIISAYKKKAKAGSEKKVKWEDLTVDHIEAIIREFKAVIESAYEQVPFERRIDLDWSDPLALLAISVLGVWESWNSEAACNLRTFLDISDDWKTAVILMEMKLADKNPQSFSAILFSGDPQGKMNKPYGDILFGRPGEDIAAGLASEGTSLENLETDDPALYNQIVDLLEKVKINKGNINVDVEMVGEYDAVSGNMELYVIQERQMPLGVKAESEDFRLSPTDVRPFTTGAGVNGGVQSGVFLDGVKYNYYEIKELAQRVRSRLGPKDANHQPGIFLLMHYVTPEEALKMNIDEIDGVVTTKIGKSSHASISAKRDGKLFICEAKIEHNEDVWMVDKKAIRLGDEENPDLFTLVGNPKSASPYSGNIYEGIMPLIPAGRRRK